MGKTLETFIKVLNNFIKYTEYKIFKISDKQYAYLIEDKSIISVLIKKDIEKEHIIVEEVFSTDEEESPIFYLCKKYFATWVTFFGFNGIIKEERAFKGVPQYDTILEKVPEFELEKRYNEWKGRKSKFTVYKLFENKEKGYALIQNSVFEKVSDKKKIESRIVQYVRESEKTEKRKYYIHKGPIKIVFDKKFVEIIKNRYLNKIEKDEKQIIYQIPDILKFEIVGYSKEPNTLDIFEKINNKRYIKQEITLEEKLYEQAEIANLPKFEDRNKDYYYTLVEFLDNPEKPLYYISEDPEIKVDDLVLVICDGFERLGRVIEGGYYKIFEAPYPVSKTRRIINKIDNLETLREHGIPIPDDMIENEEDEDIEDFEEGMEEFKDGINQTKESYHIIKVAVKSKKVADEIIKELLSKRLIASAKTTMTESTYIWKNIPTIEERFKIEMMTRGDKLANLKYIIEQLNDKKNAKIFGVEVNNMPDNMKEEINSYLDNK